MEFEFDKEIDALLRQKVREETATAAADPVRVAVHPDADEISAFAENALPEKARRRLTGHLADCDRCRVSLANLIFLNSEAADEEATAAAPAAASDRTTGSVAAVPWYRKLFGYPQLAYGLGLLVILFAGFAALIVIQNFNQQAEIARTAEPAAERDGTSLSETAANRSDADQSDVFEGNQAPETAETAASSAEETTDAKDLRQAPPQAPGEKVARSEDKERSNLADDKITTGGERADEADQVANKRVVTDQPRPEGLRSEPTPQRKKVARSPAPVVAADSVAESEAAEESRVTARKPASPPPAKKDNEDASPGLLQKSGGKVIGNDEKKSEKNREIYAEGDSAGEKRQIGRKTFRRARGIWIDTAYRNQKTTDIRRGTDRYRRLDRDLRSITDKLSGTVIIVWKTKAYKIR